jgi:two-component system response regulator HydG
MPEKIILIEDDRSLRTVMHSLLERRGYTVTSYETAELALPTIKTNLFDCIVSDFKLPNMNGIELLKEVRKVNKEVPFLIMTAYGSINIAVEAMKNGANDFIQKPFEPDDLLIVINDLIKNKRIVDRTLSRKSKYERRFLTDDPATLEILRQAEKVAKVDSPVLILGESGVGKELIARFIHENSPRQSNPFVAINCSAIPKELIESEFFGHASGAFTGATQERIGLLEYASQGTIFLDEVGDMPPHLQVKLLRAIQEGEIRKVGSNKIIKINPRIISATNLDIETLIANNKLREDFYYRIAVITFNIPALRDRRSDIALLSKFFTESFANQIGKSNIKINKQAMSWLQKYPWPGNTRELENVIERAVLLAEDQILPEHLGINIEGTLNTIQSACNTLQEISSLAVMKAEVEAINRVLSLTGGNKSKAAKLLGVSYKTLLNKVKEYELGV